MAERFHVSDHQKSYRKCSKTQLILSWNLGQLYLRKEYDVYDQCCWSEISPKIFYTQAPTLSWLAIVVYDGSKIEVQ